MSILEREKQSFKPGQSIPREIRIWNMHWLCKLNTKLVIWQVPWKCEDIFSAMEHTFCFYKFNCKSWLLGRTLLLNLKLCIKKLLKLLRFYKPTYKKGIINLYISKKNDFLLFNIVFYSTRTIYSNRHVNNFLWNYIIKWSRY